MAAGLDTGTPGGLDTGTPGGLDPLATLDEHDFESLERLNRSLPGQSGSVRETLDAIVRTVVTTIPGADFAGINLLLGERFEPQAVLGEAPTELDALQQQTGTGPCIDASREQRVIRVDDMADAPVWPKYSALALSLGVRTMLCVPLWVDEQRLGSISLYSRSPEPFGLDEERAAALVAVHAAVVLAGAQRAEHLSMALRNRDVIGQAKGILMERHRITAPAAFELLAQASQRSNRKVAQVAEELANTGVLPG